MENSIMEYNDVLLLKESKQELQQSEDLFNCLLQKAFK